MDRLVRQLDARLRLEGNQLVLTLNADDASTRSRMHEEADTLRQQLEVAGLTLATLGINAPTEK